MNSKNYQRIKMQIKSRKRSKNHEIYTKGGVYFMKTILRSLEELDDPRQAWKIKHNLGDIIGIVLFASLGNANDWHEIEAFAKAHEKTLKKYFKLENGIPSHDTIQRAMSIISPKSLQQLQLQWQEMVNSNEGEK